MPKQSAKIYLKVHPQIEHHLIAMCDENLLGTTLHEGDITFDVSEDFYGGDLVDVATCFEKLKEATIINMIGEETVNAAIKAGIVHKNSILYIQGQPHAQWVRL
jgi:hypothetical protein